CHACTGACKAEHDAPLGVNRTWIKQVEKGEFPNSRRIFSVLRCNHCTDAPCVEICPVEALYIRQDGIVDFNNDRCIGCKSCMQACPYDALYIDPDTHTAAKCNYCAHRVDIGLEPACVNVCPEHAIISGDMDDPDSEIAQTLSREQVTVRRPEKATKPNVYYINGDAASLTPSATERSEQYIWSGQTAGVGHYARFLENRMSQGTVTPKSQEITYAEKTGRKSIGHLIEEASKQRRVYDTPDKGILWGWEVSAYVLTKAIAAGVILVPFIALLFGITGSWLASSAIFSLIFLAATGALLIKDLDQPGRFLYVLFRPQWKSWLAKGGYAITLFGGLTSVWLASLYLFSGTSLLWHSLSAAAAVLVAVYTAFLFAQAKGRDFWQSPLLVLHMLVHAFMAGAALFIVFAVFAESNNQWESFLVLILRISVLINLMLMGIELTVTHPTDDAKRTVEMIVRGRYQKMFWLGAILAGNLLPLVITWIAPLAPMAGLLTLAGIYMTERIWVEAPQRIPLT
ncbi:MAG: polysulfide reductase NrfD, partial [Bacteroidetes bacterium]|nr:polysulfide reductase NrfD [Bacteroidota bacterium]